MQVKHFILGVLSLLCAQLAISQMKEPQDWAGYEEVLGVKNGLRSYNYEVNLIESSAPANVFWPGDKIRLKFQLINNTNQPIGVEGKMYVIRYGTKGIPNDTWLPKMVKLDYQKAVPVTLNIAANGYLNTDLTIDDIKEYGGYAVVFDLGKYGRRLGTSFVLSMKPSPVKMQYPKQSLDYLGVDFLRRVGVQAIRFGVPYIATTNPNYQTYMQELKRQMKNFKDNNITVMLMFGEGQTAQSMPLGISRPHLDSSGKMLRTKQDLAWMPDMDADFKKYVKELCLDYGWPNGPVTAVCLWNEPWEGTSISGWQADMLRYREIYTKMAEAVLEARKENRDVLVGGGDSNSNVWDKFFSDGTLKMLPIFDFLSIHYQGMESPVLYPEWNNRKEYKGKVKIWDTESWVGNTDDRIGLVVAANRSTGYDRSMGVYGGYMYSGDPHRSVQSMGVRTKNGTETVPKLHNTWSTAAAMGAVQNLIGERGFNRLLFQNGLPWVMVFDGYNNNKEDGTLVIAGDLGDAFGATHVLFRNVRSLTEAKRRQVLFNQLKTTTDDAARKNIEGELGQYYPITDGKMTVKADPSFSLYDFYGNQVAPQIGFFTIPLNYQGYFIRANGSSGAFDKLVAAVSHARIEGYEPLEIIPKDFTAPVDTKPGMQLQLTNILNRPIKGKLHVTIGNLELNYPQTVTFKPNESKTIAVTVKSGAASNDNSYPLQVHFDAGNDGFAQHYEEMHVNYIAKKTINVDGVLNDWTGVIPQTIKGAGKASISLTDAAWHPYEKMDRVAEGLANTYMAYDDNYFYFAARVADNTPNKGAPRFEFRDDDQYFYPDTAYMQTMYAMGSALIKQPVEADNKGALQLPAGGRVLNYFENTATTRAIGMDLDLPVDRYTRTAFYFPGINQRNVLITIYDRESGKEILNTTIENCWNGAYLNLNLTGKLRIRCSATSWDSWRNTTKLAGIFFDTTNELIDTTNKNASAILVTKDFDTQGNWIGIYGKAGYYLPGSATTLPANMQCTPVSQDDLVPLVWPKGVRRFSYRKTGTLPDGMIGEKFDNILIAFNVIPIGEDGMEAAAKGTMPRYTGYKCTDYEYALNTVAEEYGGGFEIWRMLVPGMPRKHFFPRQPKSPFDGAVKNGKLITVRKGNTLYTECAIPWSEIPDVKRIIDQGGKIKFSARINDDAAGAACMELARDRSVSKVNSRAFHPDWKEHWANEVEFGVEK
ncbi:hypothetical protein A4H97_23810 [Niastella yeongjuensis]|uniref:Uncharacterized protein n=1 Tax=Niastella yeongjuensis TaxID=354355 RepID=A0A1V9F5A0_9BACT|nr:hypothetical protein [Niastella yeongjuensis]OQP53471.1 hypothetical protein A4H97_23810 [Niastella yeongjuensis]SEP11406.1 hypothetical protein SAMN05660816_04437 [Niastella yeongjuensis]